MFYFFLLVLTVYVLLNLPTRISNITMYFILNQDGTTALHLAAQNNHSTVVTLLLDHKVDVNVADNVSN